MNTGQGSVKDFCFCFVKICFIRRSLLEKERGVTTTKFGGKMMSEIVGSTLGLKKMSFEAKQSIRVNERPAAPAY